MVFLLLLFSQVIADYSISVGWNEAKYPMNLDFFVAILQRGGVKKYGYEFGIDYVSKSNCCFSDSKV